MCEEGRIKSASTTQCWVIATGPWLSSHGVEFSPLWGSFAGFDNIPSVRNNGSISASKILGMHKKVVIIVGSEKDFESLSFSLLLLSFKSVDQTSFSPMPSFSKPAPLILLSLLSQSTSGL